MPYSNCCGAYTDMNEIDICPDCLEHCGWEYEEDLEEDIQADNQIEQTKINQNA